MECAFQKHIFKLCKVLKTLSLRIISFYSKKKLIKTSDEALIRIYRNPKTTSAGLETLDWTVIAAKFTILQKKIDRIIRERDYLIIKTTVRAQSSGGNRMCYGILRNYSNF